MEKAFEQITDAQILDLKVRTGMQRMDSTQIASNSVYASRLQLLVEAVQRVARMLNETDRTRLADALAPYLKDSAGQGSRAGTFAEDRQNHACLVAGFEKRLGGHRQPAAYPTLPDGKHEGSQNAKPPATRSRTRGPDFFFCFGDTLATLPARFLLELRLLFNGFLQYSHNNHRKCHRG